MNEELEPTSQSAPILGILSVTAPVIGTLLAFLLLYSQTVFGLFAALALIPLAPVIGIVFGIVAWRRFERYPGLTLVGVLVNAVVLVLIVTNAGHVLQNINWGGHGPH